MKVRVYYNGYEDRYIPQYRWSFFFWFPFDDVYPLRYFDSFIPVSLGFRKKDEAIEWLNNKKIAIQKERERVSVAKNRSNNIVYEDIV